MGKSQRDALADVLDRAEAEVAALGLTDREEPWFRGHSSKAYNLMPSLFRDSTLRAVGVADPMSGRDRLLELESDLFFDFQARMGDERRRCPSAWDVLFLMRHFGVPTRVMDWTTTLGVALFFAVAGAMDSARLWILNPVGLNAESESWKSRDTVLPKYLASPYFNDKECDLDDVYGYRLHDDLRFNLPVALCPSFANHRMQAQSGTFTVHGNDWRPLDQLVGDSVLRYVDLDADAIAGARVFLKDAGITERVLFPGLEGLAMEMRRRFG